MVKFGKITKYLLKMQHIGLGASKQVFISKEQVKELNKDLDDSEISGFWCYLEKHD